MPTFVTLFACTDVAMAQLARTALENAGIYCFLAHEHHVSLNWFYSNALGGVQIRVLEQDADEAMRVLSEDFVPLADGEYDNHHAGEEGAETAAPPLPSAEDFQPDLVCPTCGGVDIESINLRRRLALALLWLTNFPLFPAVRCRYKCRGCGHKWKEGNEKFVEEVNDGTGLT